MAARPRSTTVVMEGSPRARVVGTLRKWFDEGKFGAGELLPTEQALCATMQVSRGTVRAALKQLEEEGLVQGQKGQGRLRGRTVGPRAATRSSLMARTLVSLTHIAGDLPEKIGGALEATDASAVRAIRESGLHAFVLHPDSLTEAGMDRLASDPPMGVVVGAGVADYLVNRGVLRKLQGQVPVVVYSDEPEWAWCDRVISDHEAGAYELTTWLLAKGRKRILPFLGVSQDHYWVKARIRGYRKAMADAGLPALEPIMLRSPLEKDASRAGFDDGVRQVAGYLIEHVQGRNRVDAILATSDPHAGLVAGALRLFGIEPNKDIWVAGYDAMWNESWINAYEAAGPIATVDKHHDAIGQEMVRLLLARINGQLPAEPQIRVIPGELIARPR